MKARHVRAAAKKVLPKFHYGHLVRERLRNSELKKMKKRCEKEEEENEK